MSLNNAKAVLEAVFNKQSEFTRTPKYGILNRAQTWRTAKYSSIKSLLFLAELALGCYFTILAVDAFVRRDFFSLPFLMLFQVGFCYVAFCSISQWFPSWRKAPAAAPEIHV
jgi:hypothetical protein